MRFFKTTLILSFLILMMACASGRVQSDYNEHLNFRKYHTYDLASTEELNPEGRSEFNLERFVDQRFRESLHEKMREQGLRRDTTNPDVKLYYGMSIEKQVAYQTTGYGYGYPYGYWYGYGVGGVGVTTYQTSPYVYNEGTVLVSLVDTGMEEVVWHAAYTKTAYKVTKLTRQKDIDRAVKKIFKRYPAKEK